MTDADADPDALWRPASASTPTSAGRSPADELAPDERAAQTAASRSSDSPWAPDASAPLASRFEWGDPDERPPNRSHVMWQAPEDAEPERPGVPVYELPTREHTTVDGDDRASPVWSFPSDPPPSPSSRSRDEPPQPAPPEPPDAGIVAPSPEVADRSSRPRSRRVGLALAVVASIVVAVVAARSFVGDTTARADGPRLPEAVDDRWSIPLGDRFVLDAVITDGAVVVVTDERGPGGTELSAHDPIDGAELWRQPVDAVVTDLHLADESGQVVVVSTIREFADGRSSFGLDPVSGDQIWERDGDGVVLARPEMGRVALVDAGRFPGIDSELELIDMATGDTLPPVGGRLVGLGADGEVVTIDDDGDVRRLDVATYEPGGSIEATLVATTSPDRGGVFELAGRFFAATDDGLVEVGFAPDAGRVLLDRRPDEQRTTALPPVSSSSFFVQVDDRHAVMLGIDGAMGVELAGDELRVRWSADAVTQLPRAVDGDRMVLDVVDASRSSGPVGSGIPTRLVDAVTGSELFEFTSIREGDVRQPVDGVLGWSSVMGQIGDDADIERAGTVVAFDLEGTERWSIDDVVAGAFLGDRVVVIERADGDTSNLVFIDEGPRSRD